MHTYLMLVKLNDSWLFYKTVMKKVTVKKWDFELSKKNLVDLFPDHRLAGKQEDFKSTFLSWKKQVEHRKWKWVVVIQKRFQTKHYCVWNARVIVSFSNFFSFEFSEVICTWMLAVSCTEGNHADEFTPGQEVIKALLDILKF